MALNGNYMVNKMFRQFGWIILPLLLTSEESANAVPTNTNYAPELPTFGVIAKVNPTKVQ